MYFYDFVVIFALKEEFDQFKHALCVYRNKENEIRKYENLSEIDEIVEVNNKKFKLFATVLTKQGMVFSSIFATKLIYMYRPKYIILLGIAAGFDKREYGSILIADFVFPYQQGKLAGGKLLTDGGGINLKNNLRAVFNNHAENLIEEVKKTVLRIKLPKRNVEKISADTGPVATSIQVIADKKQEGIVKRLCRNAIGLEMEGYGIFEAAAEAGSEFETIPILIKAVCDHADPKKKSKYHMLAGFTSAYFFLKFLELDDIQPVVDLVKKPGAQLVPFEYLKNKSLTYKYLYKEIIRNARKDEIVRFIAITSERDFAETINSVEDKEYIEDALKRKVIFHGVVVNPTGSEAEFRNRIESPGIEDSKAILNVGAERVKEALKKKWKDFEKQIEIRYSKVGLQFKLWLSDEAAMIEPYHFGRENPTDTGGLCGFSQFHYTSEDREYKILKDHFDKLWDQDRIINKM